MGASQGRRQFAAEPFRGMSRRPCQLLVADDDPTVRLLVQAALSDGYFALTVVENGRAALAAFAARSFDLVWLDVEMPDIDGFAVGAAMRQQRGGDPPIVLVTGRSDADFFASAAALSVGHIAKPINWSLIGQQLRAIHER